MPEAAHRTVARATAPAAAATVIRTPTGPARQDFGVSAEPFPLGAVTLLPGPFLDDTIRTHSRLKSLDPDRLLHTFRRNARLPSGVVPCGGWESPGAQARGHTTGHVLSALAQAFASTGDPAFSVRANYLVDQLAVCQDRARFAGFSTGYLAAFPESCIGAVEARQPVQAPYRALHRIMAGLLDVHLLVGGARSLAVLTRMAAWTGWRNGRLSHAQRQDVLRTDFGGMNEVLANLYQLTGDPAHLTTARYFDHAEVFDPLARGAVELSGHHAEAFDSLARGTGHHAQTPKVLGAIREYHATGTARYLDIATNFWRLARELPEHLCETYDLLKLTRQLFRTDPGQTRYFDHYEKALYNRILDAPVPRGNDHDDLTCCLGAGLETGTKHGDSIYFHAGNTLYVNLFIPSVLTWAGRGMSVRQDTTFPESAATRLTITGSGRIDLRVRIPSWASGARLRVNGVAQQPVAPGTYARVDRRWVSGDVVDLSLPMALRRERAPHDRSVQTVEVGPIVLAGGTEDRSRVPTLRPSTLRPTATPLQYTAMASTGPVTLLPFNRLHGRRRTVYWRMSDAPVAFSVAAWVRLDTVAAGARIFDLGSGDSSLFLSLRDGGLRYEITSGPGAGPDAGPDSGQHIDAPVSLPAGVWTHVAVSQDGGLGVLYVNGAEVARNPALTVVPAATQNWVLRVAEPCLDGAVDGFRVHSRALTAAEVVRLHATSGPSCPPERHGPR